MRPLNPGSRSMAARLRAARILGIAPDSSDAEVRRAYRRLALRHHPDRHPAGSTAQKRAQADWLEVREAYDAWWQPSDPDHAVSRQSPPRDRGAMAPARGTGSPSGPTAASAPEASRRAARAAAVVAIVLMGGLVLLGLSIDWNPGLPSDGSRAADSSPPESFAGVPGGVADLGAGRGSGVVAPGDAPIAPAVAERAPGTPTGSTPGADVPDSAGGAGPLGTASVDSKRTFGPGAREQAVLLAQGEPTRMAGHVWWYGSARVRFRRGRVIGWDDPSGTSLRVRVEADPAVERGDLLSLGATRAQVAASLGPPTSMNGPIWRYGPSIVRFRGDRLASFRSDPRRPLSIRDERRGDRPSR